MKKFIINIFLFVCLIGFSLVGLLKLHTNNYVKKFTNIPKDYDIINLGTSHGISFVYDEFNINGAAFNRRANTLYYDLQNYYYLKPHLKDSAIIVLPVSYFSFGLDENSTDRGEINPFVNDFYRYLPRKAIYSYSLQREVDVYLNEIKLNFFHLFNKAEKKKNQHKKKINRNSVLLDKVTGRVKSHKKMGLFSNPQPNIAYLAELILDAKKSGYKPVLVTTPYFRKYNEEFEKAWLKEHYYKYIDTLVNRYNLLYLDYSDDERFSPNIEIFKDPDHLNEEGKEKFSKVFFQDLKELGILKRKDLK